MLNLITRKNRTKLLQYFEGDFDRSRMWDATPAPICLPQRTVIAPDIEGDALWIPLEPGTYHAGVMASPCGTNRVIAYECCFGAPKSFSVAALAGPEILVDFLRYHRKAAQETICFASRYYMTRRMTGGRRRLDPVPVEAWAFAHPWNRTLEPQLHEHVLLRVAPDLGALDAYPLFYHQMAIRAAYHYSLVSALRATGYGIDLGPPGSLLWEMQGITEQLLRSFSRRAEYTAAKAAEIGGRYFSQSLEQRIAALSSRRTLPQTTSGASLRDQRKRWRKLANGVMIMPVRTATTEHPLLLDDFYRHFRVASTQTLMCLSGRILAANLGSTVPLAEVMRMIEERVAAEARTGRILRGENGTLCYGRAFAAENRILHALREGLGTGKSHRLKFKFTSRASARSRRSLAAAAIRPDALRVVSLYGEPVPPVVEAGELTLLKQSQWDTLAVSRKIRDCPGELCIVTRETPHVGDFLSLVLKMVSPPAARSLVNSRQLRAGRTRYSVIHFESALQIAMNAFENRADGVVAVLASSLSERSF
ncbi:hypothetical protein DB345_09960 [Spartobacteria bacterium LR76]|nr:hypothetical protein DB345_09960 [Spartobacteria bacterium LR76]